VRPTEREVLTFLDLAAAQIEAALREADPDVARIVAAVSAIAPADHAASGAERGDDAVIAMQYHDRLTQRLLHVRDGLTLLAATLAEHASDTDQAWSAHREHVRERCSMEAERRMFDLVASGAPPERVFEALAASSASAPGEIELF